MNDAAGSDCLATILEVESHRVLVSGVVPETSISERALATARLNGQFLSLMADYTPFFGPGWQLVSLRKAVGEARPEARPSTGQMLA